MKIDKFMMMATVGLWVAGCSDIDSQFPEGSGLTGDQLQESTEQVPSRGEAAFSGMFTMMGEPYYTFGDSYRDDDFGFIMMALSQDCEGPDLTMPNSGYNWFSTCGEMSSRTPSYANPRLRYSMPYNQIGAANDIINSYPADTDNPEAINKIAQARAIRAFDYLSLAPYFQFGYQAAKDLPCVPLVTDKTEDYANNPRATVGQVYEQIMEDLNYAVEHLEGYIRPDKTKIDQQVAYGLRARAYLNMGEYAKAAEDAEKAMKGYTPASIEEVSTPSFYNINDHNWMWGIDLTQSQTQDSYATSASWLGSFSSSSYSAGTGCYAAINNLLFDKIPATDVRKGWWVDENLHSPLLATISWGDATGDDIATLAIPNVKEPFIPYTNVKFGMYEGIGATLNDNDWPLMRVEEMILIAAEGYAKSENEGKAREILSNFVTTYRDPEYKISNMRTLADEIWFQRRVELWGEGFSWNDLMRQQKPLVRFHAGKASSWPEAFQFNMTNDDPWLLMRFPQGEMNANIGIVNNTGGNIPASGQNGDLRDGVTD